MSTVDGCHGWRAAQMTLVIIGEGSHRLGDGTTDLTRFQWRRLLEEGIP